MILGGSKKQVVANMEKAFNEGRLNSKVEVGDPVLKKEDKLQLVLQHLDSMETFGYRSRNLVARFVVDIVGKYLNLFTRYEGTEKLRDITTGAIVTSNHFNPLENMTVFQAMRRGGQARTYVVSQDTNLEMSGVVGFMMKYFDTIPITKNHEYLSHQFPSIVNQLLHAGRYVLIYPEEEMWFNYRRPRPEKHGAFDFAVAAGVPVIPCFVEIIDTGRAERDNDEFTRVRYIMHVLDPIYPKPELSDSENVAWMMKNDYEQKVTKYEEVYKISIDEPFDARIDIAGWKKR